MDNKTENEKEDEYYKASDEKERERNEYRRTIIKETKQKLITDTVIQEYFKQFNELSVSSFISGYAQYKSGYMIHGKDFGKFLESKNLKNYDDALKCLKEIQWKKMFDLRCQWGANLIKLEGIETSWDFLDWKEDVFNCPFLSPISKKEFELYYQYAMSDNFVIEEDLFISLQGNTMEDESEIQLSEWFEYHNTYTGAEKYLNLPNTRVEKENYYRSLNFKNQQKEKEKLNNDKKPVKKEIDMRPDIKSYVFKDVENFVKLFEDDKTKRLFYNYEDFMPDLDRYPETDDKYLDEKAEEIYDNLSKLTHTLPIEANDDWRLALINVWDNYEIANVRKILPLVFEDYLFRVENNIQIETINRDYLPRLGEMVIEQIFNGRELCGEPRNLDF